MRVSVCVFIFVGTMLAGHSQVSWKNRFGILPLHSTRADVERLYGNAVSDSCRCNFRTAKEAIHVSFATAPCAGPEYGWNVPEETVVSFTVIPYKSSQFSEIASDLKGFVKRYSSEDVVTTYYTNVEEGIVYAVQDDRVIDVTYFPPASEKGKRCAGFPPYDGVPSGRPFSVIFGRNKITVETHLDNFAAELLTNKEARGYIVAYAGKRSRRGEAKQMTAQAKQYLIRRRMIPRERIMVIDGGFRETAEYELFSLSPKLPPPTPTPTIPSDKVQIVGSTAPAKGK